MNEDEDKQPGTSETGSKFSVEKMCKYLGVSRSGYYDWLKRKPSKRKTENAEILRVAQKSYEESKRIYGLDKLLAAVRISFPKCGRNRLYNIQKENQLYSRRKRKFKATTNSNHKLPVAENLLDQNFTVEKPNTVWVTDITYVSTDKGWQYLASVKDLCTKDIVGWAVDNHMRTELCVKALENAILRYRPQPGLIHHSDRGVQYCSKDYQELLKKHKMLCSMSRKGNCYDNASAETFFSTIKCELLYHKKYKTHEEARQDIFWYIEVFYNRQRLHQGLGYKTPAEFRKACTERQIAV
jgi:putative transposase